MSVYLQKNIIIGFKSRCIPKFLCKYGQDKFDAFRAAIFEENILEVHILRRIIFPLVKKKRILLKLLRSNGHDETRVRKQWFKEKCN